MPDETDRLDSSGSSSGSGTCGLARGRSRRAGRSGGPRASQRRRVRRFRLAGFERARMVRPKDPPAEHVRSSPFANRPRGGDDPRADEDCPVLPAAAKAPSPDSYSGDVTFFGVPHPGVYQVTISGDAAIDLFENGMRFRQVAATEATDCRGVRKSERYVSVPATSFLFRSAALRSRRSRSPSRRRPTACKCAPAESSIAQIRKGRLSAGTIRVAPSAEICNGARLQFPCWYVLQINQGLESTS